MARLISLILVGTLFELAAAAGSPAQADVFSFSTGDPDGRMATATQPAGGGKVEIETADDFIASTTVRIDQASFIGLLTGGATLANLGQVVVEIYRVFPNDSDTGRTSGPATFSTPEVPTRVNSPADVAFDSRTAPSDFTVTGHVLNSTFTATNSVIDGINPKPNQTTGGDGPVTGAEVRFDLSFSNDFVLPAAHYFFVPRVEVDGGQFLWLSAPRPIVPPGTPFSPDLQTWIRDEALQPDWLRIGTDIVGGVTAPTFNAAFSLNGETLAVPEPATLPLFGASIVAFAVIRRRRAQSMRRPSNPSSVACPVSPPWSSQPLRT